MPPHMLTHVNYVWYREQYRQRHNRADRYEHYLCQSKHMCKILLRILVMKTAKINPEVADKEGRGYWRWGRLRAQRGSSM